MNKNKKSKNRPEDEEFSLQEVLELGGNDDDYQMLKDVDVGNRSNSKDPSVDTGELKNFELENFFKTLGFDKVKNSFIIDEVESQENVSEEEDDDEPTESSVNSSTIKSATKKSKIAKQEKVEKEAPIQDNEISSTNIVEKQTVPTKLAGKNNNPKNKELPKKIYQEIMELCENLPNKPVLKVETPWYSSSTFKLRSLSQFDSKDPVVKDLYDLAESLLENEIAVFKNKKKSQDFSNDAWMKTVMASGTLSDRVASYTLMLQNAPVHNLWCLDTFLNMVKKKGKREAIIGLDAVKDVFISELLPDSRKLRLFHQQPLDHLQEILKQQKGMARRNEMQSLLIQWLFEDRLKSCYKQLTDSLKDFFLQDNLEMTKNKGMKAVLELLTSKPEQEKELLAMLVNKLGDPKYKVASKALHMLNVLIREHPLMQDVVILAVRDLLLRPNVQPKCQYYCICFLSAQILSQDRKEVADNLIQIYLGFFKAAVTKKDVDDKLLSALLTGVNRAYPYANKDNLKVMEELNTLFRTVHISSFGTSLQALMLLFQILSSRDDLSDRYFSALYSILLHRELQICTHRHPMFLNLVYRSMKQDPSESRVHSFLKRLLQTCSLQRSPYIAAVLILIAEIMKIRPSIACLFQNNQFATKSFGKDGVAGDDEDDDDEHFIDVDNNNTEKAKKKPNESNPHTHTVDSSWTHLHKKHLRRSNTDEYDPMARNPLYSNAEYSCVWELNRLCHHFHPTVSRFGSDLITISKQGVSNAPDRYPGDPLQDFTLMRFLDKFVYRNPKTKQEKDANANAGDGAFRRKIRKTLSDAKSVPANTAEFLQKSRHNPEELFLQRYFAAKASDKPLTKTKEVIKDDDDIESVSDDEFERFLSTADGSSTLEEYNFSEGTRGCFRTKQKPRISPDDEDSSTDDELDEDMDLGDQDEDPFEEDGGIFLDKDSDDDDYEDEPPRKVKKLKKGKKKISANVDALDMMLEENAKTSLDTTGSRAIRNSDQSSVKQLKWEQKREMKEIMQRKRAQRNKNFKNQTGSKFSSSNNSRFRQKKKK